MAITAEGKKSPGLQYLFWFRILFYYSFVLLPLIHPALVVYGDGFLLWGVLGLIPLQAIMAFYFGDKWLWAGGLLLVSLPLMGWTGTTIPYLVLGVWAYISTFLAFRKGLSFVLYPEPFFMVTALIRLISFSFSSQEMSSSTGFIQPLLLGLLFIGFSLYLLIIYRVSQKGRSGGSLWRETLLILLILLPLAFLALQVAPERFQPDLHRMDRLRDRKPRRNPLDGNGSEGGSSSSEDEGEEGEGGQGEGEQGNSLEMVSGDEWAEGSQGEQGGANKQYMVMVVESNLSTVYMAEEYFHILDADEGFTADDGIYLNQLNRQRYLETWRNPDIPDTQGRTDLWLKVYSVLSKPSIPYYPFMLEPMVRDDTYYPLSFSYRSLSFPSRLSPQGGRPYSPVQLSDEEAEDLWNYLNVPFSDDEQEVYRNYLDSIVEGDEPMAVRLEKIMDSFKDFQYQIGFTDDVSVEALNQFLFESKEGDCTEFSNSAALLGRMAGIPSRVVTGWLLSRDLQTPAHIEGLMELRKIHPELAEADLMDLYLITSAHHHSWTQFYLPRFGWVDYEPTSRAIPPPPGGDMNSSDVVIPRIYPREEQKFLMNLPWGLILRVGGGLVLTLLLIQYLRRRLALLRLQILSRREDERGLKALYALLIHRYNGREKEKKDPSLTPREMAEQWEDLKPFAELYTSTLLNTALSEDRRRQAMEDLRKEYRSLLDKHRSFGKILRQITSLREVR